MVADIELERRIAKQLRVTWDQFFARHGRLREVQTQVIPLILSGHNVLVTSPTASGKTEAAIAPLVERFAAVKEPWTILYIIPTRALVNDLYSRLCTPCERIGFNVIRRTGEYSTITKHPHILLTTPESFDSLLCRGRRKAGHLLAHVTAIVLDEVHLLADTARGEQTRWLLERLRRLKDYALDQSWIKNNAGNSMQIVGLSASLSDPDQIVNRFLQGSGKVVKTSGSRDIEVIFDDNIGGPALERTVQYLKDCRGPQKVLLFCNSRPRVDELAHALSKLVPQEYKVLAHHGSLSKGPREEAEQLLKTAKSVLMVSTSTLEIGIDIGDIDVVALDAPPHDIGAFLQRIGRGNRRSMKTRILPCGSGSVDALLHKALIHCAQRGLFGGTWNGLHYAVAIQQFSSFIWQSANRYRKRETLISLASKFMSSEAANDLVDFLIMHELLVENSSGIKLGEQLQNLAECGQIHTVIEDVGGLTVRDELTGKVLANQLSRKQAEKLTIGGMHLDVREERQRVLDVRVANNDQDVKAAKYIPAKFSPKMALPFAIRKFLEIDDQIWPVLHSQMETIVFHLHGFQVQQVVRLLAKALGQSDGIAFNDFCFRFRKGLQNKPGWLQDINVESLAPLLFQDLDRLENVLQRPRANKLLPLALRTEEVRSWLNVDETVNRINNSVWEAELSNEVESGLRILAELER